MSFYSRWVCGAHGLFSLQPVTEKLIPLTPYLHYGKKHTPAFCDIPHNIKMDSHKPNNSPENNFLHLTMAPALLQFILMLA